MRAAQDSGGSTLRGGLPRSRSEKAASVHCGHRPQPGAWRWHLSRAERRWLEMMSFLSLGYVYDLLCHSCCDCDSSAYSYCCVFIMYIPYTDTI